MSPVSPLSDTTTTDALLAPSTTTSTDSSSTGNRNDLWDDDSQGELVDVSEWTHEQVDSQEFGPSCFSSRILACCSLSKLSQPPAVFFCSEKQDIVQAISSRLPASTVT